MEDDDDILLKFGIPATPFSVRPRVQAVVNDSRVQGYRDMRAAAIPRPRRGDEAFRCVVCTLPGGTCEHSDGWARRAPQNLLGFGERSTLRDASEYHTDEVDVQLADLMDVVGLCNTTRKTAAKNINDAVLIVGHSEIEGADAGCISHHSVDNGRYYSGGWGEWTAAAAEPGVGAEDGDVESSSASSRGYVAGQNGSASSRHGEGDEGDDNDSMDIEDEYERDSKGQMLFDRLGNPVKKVKAEKDSSRDDFDAATRLLRGNESPRVMLDMSPWQIAAARGAAGSGALPPPPALRNYRWRSRGFYFLLPHGTCHDYLNLVNSYPEQRAADKIGDAAVDLSTPCPRGGHSLVAVNSFTLVAFGGFFCQWEIGGLNRPFADYETALFDDPKVLDDGAHYLNDLRSYDTITQCWSLIECVRCIDNALIGQVGPSGRFAHVAILLAKSNSAVTHGNTSRNAYGSQEYVYGIERYSNAGDDVQEVGGGYGTLPIGDSNKGAEETGGIIWIFGGRCANGVCSNECWLLHWNAASPMWEFVGPLPADQASMDDEVRSDTDLFIGLSSEDRSLDYRAWPPPRFDCAATNCKAGRCVALSGGRDLTGRNFGDLWLWRRADRNWEQPLIVGVPPAPRFGHALIALPGTRGEELLLLGGCCVSANAVDGLGHGTRREDLDMKVALAAQRVASAYEIEVAQAKIAAVALRADATATGHANIQRAWQGMVRSGAASATAMADRETATRFEENDLKDVLLEEAASMRWAQITGSNEYHAAGRGIRARNSEPPHTQADIPLSAHDIALGKYTTPIIGLTDGTNKGHNTRSAFEKTGGNALAAFGRTPEGAMDGMLIDLAAMVYVPMESKGVPPSARSHAVVLPLGGRIVVFGGEEPQDAARREHRQVRLADIRPLERKGRKAGTKPCAKARGGQMEVFVLDTGAAYPLFGRRAMKTGRWRWLQPPAEDSPQWLETTAVASETAVRRVERKMKDIWARALTDGVPGGMAHDLEEAEAYFRVAKWRAMVIRKEQALMQHPPLGRTQCAATQQGYRVFVHGGWRSDICLDEMLCIDLEQPDERQRRLKDEFAIRLEREVQGKGVADALNKCESDYKTSLFSALERRREKGERKTMSFEDMLSALPPLTHGPAPRCMCANASTIWLQWKPVTVDAWGLPVERSMPSTAAMGSKQRNLEDEMAKALAMKKGRIDNDVLAPAVLYYLSMKPGFNPVANGQRVRVAYIEKKRKESSAGDDSTVSDHQGGEGESRGGGGVRGGDKKMESLVDSTNSAITTPPSPNTVADNGHDLCAKDPLERSIFFSGRICKIHAGRSQGLFDVQYDDGSKEYRVQRYRIKSEQEAPWQLIYVGPNTQYAAQGLVPEFILQKETKTAVRCTFCLQTQFTEYMWDEHRRRPVPSDELSLKSCAVAFTTKNVAEEKMRVERKFKDAIALDQNITIEITSGSVFESKGGRNGGGFV